MPAGSFEITWFWTGFFFFFALRTALVGRIACPVGSACVCSLCHERWYVHVLDTTYFATVHSCMCSYWCPRQGMCGLQPNSCLTGHAFCLSSPMCDWQSDCPYNILDLRETYNPELIEAFHAFVSGFFPIEDEMDEVEVFLNNMRPDPDAFVPMFALAVVSKDVAVPVTSLAPSHFVGGIVFEYYKMSNCGLISYICVDNQHQGKGMDCRRFINWSSRGFAGVGVIHVRRCLVLGAWAQLTRVDTTREAFPCAPVYWSCQCPSAMDPVELLKLHMRKAQKPVECGDAGPHWTQLPRVLKSPHQMTAPPPPCKSIACVRATGAVVSATFFWSHGI